MIDEQTFRELEALIGGLVCGLGIIMVIDGYHYYTGQYDIDSLGVAEAITAETIPGMPLFTPFGHGIGIWAIGIGVWLLYRTLSDNE